jgi:hypothetical protein
MNELTIRKMTDAEARECVSKINNNMTNIRSLVLELYEREGWSAMGYANWRECVVAEFKGKQSYLYYQLEAAQTEKNISTIVEKTETIPESQLRPLTKLRNDPEKQKEAWQQAVATAPDGKVTAAHVASVVRGMTGAEKKESAPKIKSLPKMPEHAVYFATCAISHLERICDTDPSKQEALDMVQNWIDKHK